MIRFMKPSSFLVFGKHTALMPSIPVSLLFIPLINRITAVFDVIKHLILRLMPLIVQIELIDFVQLSLLLSAYLSICFTSFFPLRVSKSYYSSYKRKLIRLVYNLYIYVCFSKGGRLFLRFGTGNAAVFFMDDFWDDNDIKKSAREMFAGNGIEDDFNLEADIESEYENVEPDLGPEPDDISDPMDIADREREEFSRANQVDEAVKKREQEFIESHHKNISDPTSSVSFSFDDEKEPENANNNKSEEDEGASENIIDEDENTAADNDAGIDRNDGIYRSAFSVNTSVEGDPSYAYSVFAQALKDSQAKQQTHDKDVYNSNPESEKTIGEKPDEEIFNDNEEDDEEIIEDRDKYKIMVVAAAVVLLCLIMAIGVTIKIHKKSDSDAGGSTVSTTTEQSKEDVFMSMIGADKTEETQTTSEISSEDSSGQYDEAYNEAYDSVKDVGSSRFKTLEDLTFYISSNLNSILADEKIADTKYQNGEISYDELSSLMNEYIADIDELNHLLIANKETYNNAGQSDKYSTLLDDVNTVIMYGDTVIYNASNQK